MAADSVSGPEGLCVCCKKIRGSYRDLHERLWCPVCIAAAVTSADPDAVAGETLTIATAAGLRGKGEPREASLQECVNAATGKREHVGMALACFNGFLGFEGKILPGKETAICARPQLPFRGRALAVSGEHEGLFITDIKVGRYSQFISENPLPVTPLVPGFRDPEWLLGLGCNEVCRVSQVLSISVHNRTTAPVEFSAIYFGDVDDGAPAWH